MSNFRFTESAACFKAREFFYEFAGAISNFSGFELMRWYCRIDEIRIGKSGKCDHWHVFIPFITETYASSSATYLPTKAMDTSLNDFSDLIASARHFLSVFLEATYLGS